MVTKTLIIHMKIFNTLLRYSLYISYMYTSCLEVQIFLNCYFTLKRKTIVLYFLCRNIIYVNVKQGLQLCTVYTSSYQVTAFQLIYLLSIYLVTKLYLHVPHAGKSVKINSVTLLTM